MKKLFTLSLSLVALGVVFILITNAWVVLSTKDQIMQANEVSKKPIALVLGTSKYTSSGNPNLFFEERMRIAAELYLTGKVNHILVSGDNRTKYYNEPKDMVAALKDLSIEDEHITMDFAGLRTFDSIVRAKEIFQQSEITIVTQRFHCYRSLFIANKYDLKAVAVEAGGNQSISQSLAIREVFARSLAVLDLYVLGRMPTHLGEPIEIKIKQ